MPPSDGCCLLLQMKPYNIYVTVAYPPDTDTPGLAEENKSKVVVFCITYFISKFQIFKALSCFAFCFPLISL